MSGPVITVEKLCKEYRSGVRLKKIRAVVNATFSVGGGEIFGFVGPNGAGKTTTIRALLGLIRPTSGTITVLGDPVPSQAARMRLGFLPESPYFYDYLSARELLDLVGSLFGLGRAERRKRAGELLEKVGLGQSADRPMRKYSKGMLQRAGLAQALMNDPELVILDEPMSGLDPVGRKEVRDLMVALRDAGKTVFFSTHILPDVEAICDRIAIISHGTVHDVGPVSQILQATLLGTDVVLWVPEGRSLDGLVPKAARVRQADKEICVSLPRDADVEAFLKAACDLAKVVSVTPRRESLEDVFVKMAAVPHVRSQPHPMGKIPGEERRKTG
ncbi:MAG: ABC transporter ATP-binding protein [Deltaproteobacteria bacterium]|nr:ABC transporter ATP-binding protein [Deltaproteobacteria bacterium]